MRCLSGLPLVVLFSAAAVAQNPPVPKPFPQPAQPTATVVTPPVQRGRQTQDATEQPTEASLGVAIYPSAEFITSYDAGQGQRYYLFGTNASFADVVTYYKGVLKDRGDLVFEEPPVHQFDIGRFREESMAFPPSVTVKDYTWGGMQGYLNPKPGAQPVRFRTIIQIVPSPAGETER